jgi:tRNA (5-methylaminomethyl-2-thiouridylate)-methyltransferase
MKIAALVSGGVDSSVALGRLIAEGHRDITAFYLKIWLEDELSFLGECPWEVDLKYARSVCETLGVPLEIVSMQREYNDFVVQYTIKELKEGRTPSPDLYCNQMVKFGAFLDHIDSGFDKIATGHYAQIIQGDSISELHLAKDRFKDQTYFLSKLSIDQLNRCLFPLGDIVKSDVRQMAKGFGLSTYDRPDSQGICFLGKIKFHEFAQAHLGNRTGKIVEKSTGKVLGQHQGYWFHTIGQRKGLRLHGGPWFVVDKNVSENIVYVAHLDSKSDHSKSDFEVSEFNWLMSKDELKKTLPHIQTKAIKVKVRHGERMVPCEITEMKSEGRFKIKLSTSDDGIANGQFAVLYDQDRCVGSGVITL